MIDAFSTSQPFKDCGFFITPVCWYQDGHGLPHHLLGGIAVETLCAFIPARDDAIQVLGDNRIVGGFDNRSEAPCVSFRSAAPLDFESETLLQCYGPIDGAVKRRH